MFIILLCAVAIQLVLIIYQGVLIDWFSKELKKVRKDLDNSHNRIKLLLMERVKSNEESKT